MNTWSKNTYSSTERRLDAVVQIVATVLAAIAACWLVLNASAETLLSLTIYGTGLLIVFATSLGYTFAKPGPTREVLRRFDHAVIFVMIAGTYTPLVANKLQYPWNSVMLFVTWVSAAFGVALKFLFPRRFEYAGMALCIAMGLSGVVVVGRLHDAMSPTDFHLLIAGAVSYLVGVAVLQLANVRFHNAAWHTLVLIGASLHFVAIAGEFITR